MSNGPSRDTQNQLLEALHSGRNWLGFSLRNFLRWEPGSYREPLLPGYNALFRQPDAKRRATELMSRYPAIDWDAVALRQRGCEILTYLDWLDTFQQAAPHAFQPVFSQASCLNWLDVGAKNWSYVDALAAFIQANRSNAFQLDGIELDPNRRYLNLQTRRQAALAHSHSLPHTIYHEGDVLQWTQPAAIISHFLPFVFKDPHLAWGLPLKHFKPEAVLWHTLSLLEPGGLLIIVNQGQMEADAQAEMLAQAARCMLLRIENLGQLPARFIEYRYPRYGWIVVKEDT